MSRNLVLVTADSLRADHCGFLEDGRSSLTPTLDGMAEEGVVFEKAIAPGPRTPSSMPESFTGEPLRPKQYRNGDYWQRRRAIIRQHMRRHRSVAERLKERGYSTIGITVNPWTQDTEFDTGFDRYVEVNGDTLESYGPPIFKRADRLLRRNRVGDRLFWHNKREWFIRWTDFYETIAAALDTVERPFFLWVFLLDAHQPYIAPRRFRQESSAFGMYYASFSELSRDGNIPSYVESWLQKAYRDSVRSVDAFVEQFWRIYADTDPIFLLHADHGEAFGEHGTYGHERQLYEENIHVPFIVTNTAQRGRVTEPLHLSRLPEILVSLADQGTFSPERFTSDFAVSTAEDCQKTAVSGRTWKYIQKEDSEELYHLGSDAAERRNVVARYPAVTSTLRSLAERRRNDQRERAAISDVVRARVANAERRGRERRSERGQAR